MRPEAAWLTRIKTKTMNNGYLDMELLRVTTAGSVDDGKSTLIGRLLYDSKSIFEDQLEAVKQASESRGNEEVNLALLTDGLRAEREQGITIDVAYRYFATPKRKFIIADTPGHIQYTRNMVTGASSADLALILVDVRNGVVEQTVRHSCIASLLGIPYIFICVNKMDIVDFDQNRFEEIKADYLSMANSMSINSHLRFIPISAKHGNNVVKESAHMPWYTDGTLMHLLETVPINHKTGSDEQAMRFPVQYVIRPISDRFPDYRAYAGRLAEGKVHVGDEVIIYPSMLKSKVKAIMQAEKSLDEAYAPQSVSLLLEDDIDISRGDIMVSPSGRQMQVNQTLSLMCCWLNPEPLRLGTRYILKTATAETMTVVKSIDYRLNINTMQKESGVSTLDMNDIACITIHTSNPVVFDSYNFSRTTGSLILIEPASFETICAGMIC